MSRAVQDAKDNDGIGPQYEKDAIGEACEQDASHFGPAAQALELPGVGHHLHQGIIHLSDEIITEPVLLFLIPHGGFGNVGLGLVTDNQTISHGFSLA